MSIVLNSSGGGSVTINEPATASNFTHTLPAADGTLVLAGTTPSFNGIAFPATQSASADANTLDDYEEGTWTPSQGSGLTVVGAFSSAGKYTKIGRVVTIAGYVSGSTQLSLASGGQICANLPFSQTSEDPYGIACLSSSSNQSGSSFVLTLALTGSSAMTAASNIKFSTSYFV
jgi:hypothetical protein